MLRTLFLIIKLNPFFVTTHLQEQLIGINHFNLRCSTPNTQKESNLFLYKPKYLHLSFEKKKCFTISCPTFHPGYETKKWWLSTIMLLMNKARSYSIFCLLYPPCVGGFFSTLGDFRLQRWSKMKKPNDPCRLSLFTTYSVRKTNTINSGGILCCHLHHSTGNGLPVPAVHHGWNVPQNIQFLFVAEPKRTLSWFDAHRTGVLH